MQSGDNFLENAQALIVEHASNEQFGVSELAEAMNMSRSNLLRKIQKNSGLSASQFIRKIRLEIAMDMLKETSFSVSEISYKVGFGSTSYFIKCFRELYGFPPGEVGKEMEEPMEVETHKVQKSKKSISSTYLILFSILAIVIVVGMVYKYRTPSSEPAIDLEKSIAVLPFKNESNDSANVYFINGLMESTLSNLQKIKDLRVISRTTVERYRNSDKAIPEIAKELNVNYFVEGSGQKIGDQVLLHIQLIDARNDHHLWAEEYNYKLEDIFSLQQEISTKIADAIKAFVTPAELEQIEKIPTENLKAYDYYLQGLDLFQIMNGEGLLGSIALFEKATEEDPQFALAYAYIAIAYHILDAYQMEKQYTMQINNNADKALLYDSRSAESLLAKAFYYMNTDEYRLALPHLEKALEYNPNSSSIVQTLSDIYARFLPNTAKYLEYALKGIQLNIPANDSIQLSYIYLHLANAYIQNGFVEEALETINQCLAYNPRNEYGYIKAFILYAKDYDLEMTKKYLIQVLKKDTTRLDILQEVGKVYYYQENYDSAFYYYEKFVLSEQLYGMDIFPQEDIKIGLAYEKMGKEEQAKKYFKAYNEFLEKDESIYNSAMRAVVYTHEGKTEEAIKQLKIFSTQDNYQYWVLLFLEKDPLINPLKSHPEFDGIMQEIKDRFWENQANLKKSLIDKGLL